MAVSPLADFTILSKNHGERPAGQKIDVVTIHCLVAQWDAKQIGAYFNTTEVDPNLGSPNYGIGKDGKVVCCVPEELRSWCSSNRDNDGRAITIEVASDMTPPYAVTTAAYNKLIDLLVDICKRNNIDSLKWCADPSLIGQTDRQNMTVHRWFANKSCPGEWLYSRYSEIAEKVNERLKTDNVWYRVQVGAFRKKENAKAYVTKLKEIGIDAFIVEGK